MQSGSLFSLKDSLNLVDGMHSCRGNGIKARHKRAFIFVTTCLIRLEKSYIRNPYRPLLESRFLEFAGRNFLHSVCDTCD